MQARVVQPESARCPGGARGGLSGCASRRFTLVEMLAVIVILGILGAVGTLGLKAAVEGYVTGRSTMSATQKAQNALQRMVMELRFVEVDPETGELALSVKFLGTQVSYLSKHDMATHTIAFQGDRVTLDNGTLVDGVSSFEAEYDESTGELRLSLTMAAIGVLETVVFP